MKIQKQPQQNEIILEGYRGSISMGMYVENSIDDKDLFGIFVPPKEYVIGLQNWECYEHKKDEWDVLYYSLKKFISLALKGNPNTLCLLWLNPEFYTKITPLGQLLIDNRDIFTSREAYWSFAGYASDQLRRMTHLAFKGYMGEKRKQLVEQFGFDTKNAAHCIRLLRMSVEFLQEGRLNVFRKDKEELLDIKKGKWSLEQIQKEAERLFALAEETHEKSTIAEKPNYNKAEELLIDITETYWNRPHA